MSRIHRLASEPLQAVRTVTGTAKADKIKCGSSDDIVQGLGGADTLDGGKGFNTLSYEKSTAGVTVNLATGKASGGHAAGDKFRNFQNLTGSKFSDKLTGDAAANLLDGKGGADMLAGGAGNDVYVVDNESDRILENSGEGVDEVRASLDWVLGDQLEQLTLTGNAAIRGTGNGLNNRITGNSANNVLNGGAGDDELAGGTGDDLYFVDTAGDAVLELAGGGTDTVSASVTFTLASHVENLELTGSAKINGTGNSLGNRITGNRADNVLDGGEGADALAGGEGNDSYIVDDAGDTVTELEGQGEDSVFSSVAFVLGTHVENLTLTGNAAVSGTGNALANHITGNAGNNVLNGAGGNDVISGGQGNDTLEGGDGSDTAVFSGKMTDYSFSWENGVLTVTDNRAGADGVDVLTGFEALRFADQTYTGSFADLARPRGRTIIGTDADDTIEATSGDDKIFGLGGDDVIWAQEGNDVLIGGAGADYLCGSGGDDAASYESSSTGVIADLGQPQVNSGDATGDSYDGIENLIGSSHADLLRGDEGDNVIWGLGGNDILGNLTSLGNDTLYGGAGNDELADGFGDAVMDGGAGNDVLTNGGGSNRMTGGEGADTFRFVLWDSMSFITDFSAAEGDRILQKLTPSADLLRIDDGRASEGNYVVQFFSGGEWHDLVQVHSSVPLTFADIGYGPL